jgi:ABC-type transporter Mla subunit MlaD
LNQWQQTYKDQLVIMIEQVRQSINVIETVKNVLTEIAEKTNSIPVVMSNLQHIIEVTDRQIQNLEQTLTSFASLRKQAIETFPIIETNLKTLTTGIEKAISKM